ncbi:beta-lactamase-like protein [Zopfochytrium polystomum]|nr:beta-lactamase-like protein [Zopfochytrium polystomum]
MDAPGAASQVGLLSAGRAAARPDHLTWLLNLNGCVRILTGCPLQPTTKTATATTTKSHAAAAAAAAGNSSLFSMNYLSVTEWDKVDAILLSSYEQCLGLPFVTEYTAFAGKVYATDPCIEFAKIALGESLSFNANLESNGQIRPWFTKADVQSCLRKVQRVRFNQQINTGLGLPSAPAASLGNSHWILSCAWEKILLLSSVSTQVVNYAASMQSFGLASVDHIVCSGVQDLPSLPYSKLLSKVYSTVGQLLDRGESLALFCRPFGMLFDLIEVVNHSLSSLGLTKASMHVISPVALTSLKLCSMFGEWMNPERQQLLFDSQYPLPHSALLDSRQLTVHDSITAFSRDAAARKPFVAFFCVSEFDAIEYECGVDELADLGQQRKKMKTTTMLDFRANACVAADEFRRLVAACTPATVVAPAAFKPDLAGLGVPNAVWVDAGAPPTDVYFGSMDWRVLVSREIIDALVDPTAHAVQGDLTESRLHLRRSFADPRRTMFVRRACRDALKKACVVELRGTLEFDANDRFVVDLDEARIDFDGENLAWVTEWLSTAGR